MCMEAPNVEVVGGTNGNCEMVSAPGSLHLNSRGWLGTLRGENKVTSAIHRSWKKCCEKSKEKAGILISGLG